MNQKNKLLAKLKQRRDEVADTSNTAVPPVKENGKRPASTESKSTNQHKKLKTTDKSDKKANQPTETKKALPTLSQLSHKAKIITPTESSKKTQNQPNAQTSHLTALQKQMQDKLQGGQFRWLNEKLYTTTSEEAFKFMSEEPEMFKVYHDGFRVQVEKWPVNPVDIFIKYLKGNPNAVVGDFGCGDAKIAESVKNKVHSFDLVAVNERVTACDMRNVPLKADTLDVAIFSLSLMGVNFLAFLKEAHRVLKLGGALKIAEVRSRFDEQKGGIERFVQAVSEMGFEHKNTDRHNKMFVLFDFVKAKKGVAKIKHADGTLLKPCIYKRR